MASKCCKKARKLSSSTPARNRGERHPQIDRSTVVTIHNPHPLQDQVIDTLVDLAHQIGFVLPSCHGFPRRPRNSLELTQLAESIYYAPDIVQIPRQLLEKIATVEKIRLANAMYHRKVSPADHDSTHGHRKFIELWWDVRCMLEESSRLFEQRCERQPKERRRSIVKSEDDGDWTLVVRKKPKRKRCVWW